MNYFRWMSVPAFAASLVLHACSDKPQQPAQTPDTLATTPRPDTTAAPRPDTAMALSPDHVDTVGRSVMVKPHVEHVVVHDASKIAPMPTGVREYQPEPAYVDNTPDPEPNEIAMVEQEPLCLNCQVVDKTIVWPVAARNEGVGGEAYFKLLIDYTGKVKRYVVRKRTDARLVNAVAAALPNLRFRPAFKGGQPVKAWANFVHTFK